MAANPVGSAHKRSNSARYPSAEHPAEIDPGDYPDFYASTLAGSCLEPKFRDGDCLVFSKTEACMAGDYVGVWLHPDIAAGETSPRRIKRLLMGLPPGFSFPFRPAPTNEVMPLVMLEQLNPPRRYSLPVTDIVAIHKVIGTGVLNGDGTAMTDVGISDVLAPGLDLFAAAWLQQWVEAGGSVHLTSDGKASVGFPVYHDSPAYVEPAADLPEAVRFSQEAFRDAHYHGKMRGFLAIIDAPGGYDALKGHMRAHGMAWHYGKIGGGR